MKKSIKKSLSIIIILFILLQIFTPLTVKAENLYPTKEETKQLLEKIPDEITLDIKESEFEKAEKLARTKIINILGLSYSFPIYCVIKSATQEEIDGKLISTNLDIHKMKVFIETGEDENNIATTKVITVKYSNTNKWNEKEYEYINELCKNTNFDLKWYYDIAKSDEYKDTLEFDWKTAIEQANNKELNDIQVISLYTGWKDDDSVYDTNDSFFIYVIKNDIVYYFTKGTIQNTATITIPNSVGETDEACINYAKKVIELDLSFQYTAGSVTTRFEYVVSEMKRDKNNPEYFVFKLDFKEYFNGVYNATYDSGRSKIILKREEKNETNLKLGDIDGNDKIDTIDAVKILQYVAKKIDLDENQKKSADVNKDGKIDTLDAVRILQYIAKKIDIL